MKYNDEAYKYRWKWNFISSFRVKVNDCGQEDVTGREQRERERDLDSD